MLHGIRALELTDDAGHSYRVTTSLGEHLPPERPEPA